MIALIYPLTLAGALHAGGLWYWALVPLNLVLIPAADHLLKRFVPAWRPSPRLLSVLFATPVYWVYAVAQGGVLIAVLRTVQTVPMSAWEFIGLISSTGIMTGTAGITAAHELIHRRSAALRALGLTLLAMTTYMHFRIQHVFGHHRNAATPADPGTARLGEGFPAFFGRALVRGYLEALALERGRIARAGLAGSANRMLHYAGIQLALYGAIWGAFGGVAALFFLAQSLMAVHLLEGVNYVQHYGLQGAAAGPRPRAAEADAWDSDFRASELVVFHLTRHADHHVRPGQTAQVLRVVDDSPKLPGSFFLMVFLALFPPVWRRLMDRRAQAWNAHRAALVQPHRAQAHLAASIAAHPLFRGK